MMTLLPRTGEAAWAFLPTSVPWATASRTRARARSLFVFVWLSEHL